jgi:hypothetical protein
VKQFKKLAELSKDARKLQRSDLSDLLHCHYLPYVDLFRADDYTRSLLGKIARAHHVTLVPSTLALPEAIEKAAEARRAG